MTTSKDWKLFTGAGEGAGKDVKFPEPPPWRDFQRKDRRAKTYLPASDEIEMVNAALYLRRPLLLTGKPGSGKSSLIYAVAAELGLREVLVWPISSRSSVRDGLYRYDAIGRLRDANLAASKPRPATELAELAQEGKTAGPSQEAEGLARYLRLGPLGTALLPEKRPRALLIDEIDKADIDFANDLLHVFEEGSFEIDEARRIKETDSTLWIRKFGREDQEPAEIIDGKVQCTMFPFVVITSNGERDLSPAFLRRCLRLEIPSPDVARLETIVRSHFEGLRDSKLGAEIDGYIARVVGVNAEKDKAIATDQLLSVIHMIQGAPALTGKERARILDNILRELNQGK